MAPDANILAIDPGSKECAWALVRSKGPRVRYVAAGRFANEVELFLEVADDCRRVHGLEPDVLGLERPAGFVHDPFRGPTVLATAYVAGGIAWLASSRGTRVIELTAEQGRKLVLGKARGRFAQKRGDLDRLVKEALPNFVSALPVRTNEHVRDALLVAIATNWLRLQPRKEAP